MIDLSEGGAVFITGIGTDIGKTVVSAVIAEAFKEDYWKPVQAGNLDESDSIRIQSLVNNQRSVIHPEAYRLGMPASPHEAAAIDKIEIQLSDLIVPVTENTLIIEGAGGLMVPLNNNELLIDFIEKTGMPVILVSSNYLGSINHTLLSAAALKAKNIPVMGLIFNGNPNPATEEAILKFSGLKRLATIPHMETITKETIVHVAGTIDKQLFKI